MPMIGEIRLFGGQYAPKGWLLCDGTVLKVQDHVALYCILGASYGGDRSVKFSLPNMAPVVDTDGIGDSRYIICCEGEFPARV